MTFIFIKFVRVSIVLSCLFPSNSRYMSAFARGSSTAKISRQIQEALTYHKSGDFINALNGYERTIPLVSGKVASQLSSNAGAIYMQQGDYESAAAKFKQAVEAQPDSAEPHFNLAVVLNSRLQQNAKAIKHCALAIRHDPEMHKAYHLMGNILQDIGRPEEADKYFTLAENLANEQQAVKAESSRRDDDTNTLSGGGSYKNLWVWGARLNDTFSFKLVDGSWVRSAESTASTEADDSGVLNSFSMTCVSERPLIFDIPLLLLPDECDHVTRTATPLLQTSQVMGRAAATSQDNDKGEVHRSSKNAWLPRDEVLAELQMRVAALVGLSPSYVQLMSEDLQVVQYDAGGQFQLHHDSSAFHPRMLTALVYLDSKDLQGGETWFPYAPREHGDDFAHESLEDAVQYCTSGESPVGLEVPPVKGRAIIFFNHLADGRIDHSALHAGKKLQSGTKWVANYWIKLDEDKMSNIMGNGKSGKG